MIITHFTRCVELNQKYVVPFYLHNKDCSSLFTRSQRVDPFTVSILRFYPDTGRRKVKRSERVYNHGIFLGTLIDYSIKFFVHTNPKVTSETIDLKLLLLFYFLNFYNQILSVSVCIKDTYVSSQLSHCENQR